MDLTWISNRLQQGTLSYDIAVALLIMLACAASFVLMKRWAIRLIAGALQRTKNQWDDTLVEKGVFDSLAYLAPAVVIYYGATLFPKLSLGIRKLVVIYVVLNVVLLVRKALAAALAVYDAYPIAKRRPIKGYLQIVTLLTYILGGIVVVSLALDRSPWGLLTGLGALTAVLLLVFRDTILSFIASIQLTLNDMVRVGDWIEMPKYGVDGDVIDMALHTVKVRNWDMTIVTVPTYRLIEESFKNWRGMKDGGGRRIMRSLQLDQRTIRFLRDEEIAELERIQILKPYIESKRNEIAQYNDENRVDPCVPVNGRRMTNVGTFRAYMVAYLRSHPKIHQKLTFLVRQLEPTAQGLPLQVYVFTNDTAWANYEAIQADIFDHLLAAVTHFGLKVYQAPSGHDVAGLARQQN